MADNIYKNSDPYKRDIDKLTSTSNERDQSTPTKVVPEKDTKESKNVDKKGSIFENGSSNDIKSIVFGLFALIGFLIIVYSIFVAVIGEPLASVADTVFIAALIGSFTLVGTIVSYLYMNR